MDWTAGYTADIEYIAGFFRELSPTYLNFACVVNGFQPVRTGRTYTYCELGCGRGLTLNVLAATNPRGHFYGVDFNPAHISGAALLAETAGLSNVTFLENSFEALVEGKVRDLPRFDFIVLHGVYAWVGPKARHHVRRFIDDFLKPGGIVFVSYNAMPGWAPMAPLQRLVREVASLRAGASDARLNDARDVVRRMVELQTAYLAGNSAIAARLEDLTSGHPQYLAHEYLNEQSEPLYHADVARQLFDDSKLQFVGSADLPLAMPAIYLKQEARDLLKTVSDAATAETIKDYFLNTAFRKDVYVRGARALNQQHQIEALARFGLALCIPREQVTLKMKLSFGEIVAREEVHTPILDALASRPHGIAELAALPALKDKPIGQVVLAAALLIASMQAAIYPIDASPESSQTCRALNLTLADQVRYGDDFQVLASPMLASGISVTLIGSLVYRLLAGNGAAESDTSAIAQRVWQTMSSAGRRLEKDQKKIEGDEANLAETKRLVEQVITQRLPLWRQLGII